MPSFTEATEENNHIDNGQYSYMDELMSWTCQKLSDPQYSCESDLSDTMTLLDYPICTPNGDDKSLNRTGMELQDDVFHYHIRVPTASHHSCIRYISEAIHFESDLFSIVDLRTEFDECSVSKKAKRTGIQFDEYSDVVLFNYHTCVKSNEASPVKFSTEKTLRKSCLKMSTHVTDPH